MKKKLKDTTKNTIKNTGVYTTEEREKLAKQYVSLVKKIVNQYHRRCSLEYDEIEGFAWEGFTESLNEYDPARSKMTFKSYAAFRIRNCILNGINTYSRTIKVSRYAALKAAEEGSDMPVAISLSKLIYTSDDNRSKIADHGLMGVDNDVMASLGLEDATSPDNPWNILHASLTDQFGQEWTKSFCETYGVCGYDARMGKDIAVELGLTPAAITRRNGKMLDFIRHNKELVDQLSECIA